MSIPVHRTTPGSSYFVTTKCWGGRTVFQVTETVEIMVETLFHYRDSGAYLLHEFVIMPDHLHLLLTPGRETSLEKAVQLIKGGSSFRIHHARRKRSEIWQVGFYDWTIRDTDDWQTKAEYIRMNPVRAKLVERAEDWRYCSASGRFRLDPTPEKYLDVASGAKAPDVSGGETRGLKPPPPKEEANVLPTQRTEEQTRAEEPRGGKLLRTMEEEKAAIDPIPQGLKPVVNELCNVGAKAPTPGALTESNPGPQNQDQRHTEERPEICAEKGRR